MVSLASSDLKRSVGKTPSIHFALHIAHISFIKYQLASVNLVLSMHNLFSLALIIFKLVWSEQGAYSNKG